MLDAGIPRKTIEAWSVDPQVTFGPVPITKSLFDSLEDTDADYCLALCTLIARGAGCPVPCVRGNNAKRREQEGARGDVPSFCRTHRSTCHLNAYVHAQTRASVQVRALRSCRPVTRARTVGGRAADVQEVRSSCTGAAVTMTGKGERGGG